MKPVIVYLGLGSNLGDRKANLQQALELLPTGIKVTRISPVYDTAPVGNVNQSRFLNLAIRAETAFPPDQLLKIVKTIEEKMGRTAGPRNSPRPIDIDILFYDKLVMETPTLVIPHPRLTERAFVLAPLADIAPRLRHPGNGKTVMQMLKELVRIKGDAILNK